MWVCARARSRLNGAGSAATHARQLLSARAPACNDRDVLWRVALLVAACGGCNALFGIDTTVAVDALPDVAITPPHLAVTYQQLIGPGATPLYPKIDQVNSIQVGALGSAMLDTVMLDASGGAELPRDRLMMPTRVVVQVPGESVPRELQWTEPPNAHLVAPILGRLPRTPPQAGAAFHFNIDAVPTGQLDSNPDTRVFTIGAWTSPRDVGVTCSPPLMGKSVCDSDKVAFGGLTPLGGGADAFDASQGDEEVIVSFRNNSTTATGFTYMKIALGVNQDVTTTTTWGSDMDPQFLSGLTVTGATTMRMQTRFQNALGMVLFKAPVVFSNRAGVILSSAMPSMTTRSHDATPSTPLDETPMFYKFEDDALGANGDVPRVNWANPLKHVPNTVVVASRQVYVQRTITNGPTLSSGVQGMAFDNPASLDFPVELATQVTFANVALTGTLIADDRTVTLPMAGFVELAFDAASATRVDDCLATLYQVKPQFAPVRTYQVVGGSGSTAHLTVSVDAALFQVGTTYAFGIVCRDGYPNAGKGDYTTVSYPMSQSQIFPATFQISH